MCWITLGVERYLLQTTGPKGVSSDNNDFSRIYRAFGATNSRIGGSGRHRQRQRGDNHNLVWCCWWEGRGIRVTSRTLLDAACTTDGYTERETIFRAKAAGLTRGYWRNGPLNTTIFSGGRPTGALLVYCDDWLAYIYIYIYIYIGARYWERSTYS